MKRAPRSPQMDRLTVDFMARHGLLCACKVVTGKQLLFYGIAGGLVLLSAVCFALSARHWKKEK